MTHFFRNSMGLRQREIRINFNIQHNMQSVSDPASARLGDGLDARSFAGYVDNLRNDMGIDGIEYTREYAARSRIHHAKNCYGNHQARDRVGQAHTKRDTDQTDEGGK